MAGKLTTHALDTVLGTGAAGLRADLRRLAPNAASWPEFTLDAQGRAILLESEEVISGTYELRFHVADYHRQHGVVLTDPPFLNDIVIAFGIADANAHYHVPILFSPFSYSTYRGS